MFQRQALPAPDPLDARHIIEPQSGGSDDYQPDADGGAVVYLDAGRFRGRSLEDLSHLPHGANLAEALDESMLSQMANDILEGIEADLLSKREWDEILTKGMELLGFKIEEKAFPFRGAAGVYHPVMTEAVLRTQANLRGEMLPAEGPAKTKLFGDETPDETARADRMKNYLNYHLTEVDEGYYSEYDKMLLWVCVGGNAFKKVFRDPLKGRAAAPFVLPDQLIVNYAATSLATADRITQLIPTSRSEMIRMQLVGHYRKVDLSEPDENDDSPVQLVRDRLDGRRRQIVDGEERYTVYESMCVYDIEVPGVMHVGPNRRPSGLPLPYIVSIDRDSRKVLSVYRNWEEGDPKFATGPERSDYYVHYELFPGLGFYAFGYAHIMGGIAKGATTILRQLMDAGTLSNFPGGVRVKGLKMAENTLAIGPNEFVEIETNGLPIQQAIMPMPYRDPQEVMIKLLEGLVEAAQRLGSTMDLQVGEGRQDAPVGTTMSLIEQAVKMLSAAMKRLYVAQRKELRLIARVFAQDPTAVYPYKINGQKGQAVAADFADTSDIVPVSDPNLPTQAQRLGRADAKLNLADRAPELHDRREAYGDIYREMGLSQQEIDRIMPPPARAQPADPITEFQNALKQMPLAAGQNQNHDAHITSHLAQAKTPGLDKSPAYAALLAHVLEHVGMKYRGLVMASLQQRGITLPPPGQPLPPALEQQISVIVSAKAEQILQLFQQSLDPQLALEYAQIEQKDRELEFKKQDAERKGIEEANAQSTDMTKEVMQLHDGAAKRQADVIANQSKTVQQLIKARGDIISAGITAGMASEQIRHDTLTTVLEAASAAADRRNDRLKIGSDLVKSGIAAQKIGHEDRKLDVARVQQKLDSSQQAIDHKQADAAILSAKAEGIAARKPTPRPSA